MDITIDEKKILITLLDQAMQDYRTGIHHSYSFEFRDNLKAEEVIVGKLLEKIHAAETFTT